MSHLQHPHDGHQAPDKPTYQKPTLTPLSTWQVLTGSVVVCFPGSTDPECL